MVVERTDPGPRYERVGEAGHAVTQVSRLLGYCGEVAERFEREALAFGSFRAPADGSHARDTRPSIAVCGLSKTYADGVEAVKGIEFEVGAGEVFGLLGPNGAGKSTTVGMLTTTIVPSAGSARLGGFDIAAEPLAARRLSSVVFQEPALDRALSGRRTLELHARLWAVERSLAARRIDELSAALGIAALLERPVASYSGGERRRLELARALLSDPCVLFLDEPTVGLDPRIRHELLDTLTHLRERGELTILLTTHYLDEAERLCDRGAIMHAGRIVALATPRALLAGLGRELVELRVQCDPQSVLALLRSHGADAFAVGSTVSVPLRGCGAREAIELVHRLGLGERVSTRQPTLDDVFLHLTGDRLAAAA